MIDVSLFSDRYFVRRMASDDVGEIYKLCRNNALYYKTVLHLSQNKA